MKKFFLILIPLVLICLSVTWFVLKEKSNYQTDFKILRLGDAELKVELAQSQGARAQGLGGRKSLPQGQGMLFIFDKPDVYPFWMRDMNFPIDIIWLDSDFRVVDLAEDVKPETYPNYFVPTKKALYVLETSAGWSKKNNIKTGSKAILR
ncbi:MAG: DUF192 domain-containing protein [bacterium]|nr:DUF192 domain-containing protein [bacterium]